MPTRTLDTEQDYRNRSRRIAEFENAAAGRDLSPVELARAVTTRTFAPATIRQMRAALIFTMTEIAEAIPGRAASLEKAIAVLRGWASPKSSGEPRTSQWKQKNAVEDDLTRIRHAALATTSANAEMLVAALDCGELTGARFTEWPSAKFGPCAAPGFAWELILTNGKAGNGRAHGETRTLRWERLPDQMVSQMTLWITVAEAAVAEGRFETLRDTLEALMRRVTKALFPRRMEHPTPSSVRHAAAARFKAAYVATAKTKAEKLHGLAIVAALLGHASDATATAHYARSSSGGSRFPVPTPDPTEVARIRQRFSAPRHREDPGPDDKPRNR